MVKIIGGYEFKFVEEIKPKYEIKCYDFADKDGILDKFRDYKLCAYYAC